MPVRVKFWGTRGSIPTPGDRTRKYGGNTSCVEVRFGDLLFILDGGSGIRELGADLLSRRSAPIEAHILFSHAHWDHIQGFPFFAPAYIAQNRFHIYGPSEGDDRFHRLLSGQMKSDYFPVDFGAMRAEIIPEYLDQGRKIIEGIDVRTFPLNHPGGCLGYSLRFGGRTVVYASDNDAVADGELGEELRDLDPALVEFARDADLLIADGQYTDGEYAAKKGWGHSSCLTAVDLALQAGVRQLAIFHHDPTHSDSFVDQMVESSRGRVQRLGGELKVFAAREGVELRYEAEVAEAAPLQKV